MLYDELSTSLQQAINEIVTLMRKPYPSTPSTVPPAPPAQMALFRLSDGATLEVHIPNATSVELSSSTARTPGFILRRGPKITNIGALTALFHE